MNIYNPDKWIILKFNQGYKVLGGWYGGYLSADTWRLSSGVERIEKDGDNYLIHNYSGSVYNCHKDNEGFTSLSRSMYKHWKEIAGESEENSISTITAEEFNAIGETDETR